MHNSRLSQGTLLDGRFEVQRLIKAGGMGAVYEVTDRLLKGKTFALKEIHPNSDAEEHQSAKMRFIAEIQVMQTLMHPSIPKISDAFFHDNSFFFVMELLQGTDLSRKRRKEGNPGLPVALVVSWAVQVLDALEYLHGQTPPVIHRDIKPSNLFLRESDGRVMLIDFGIARATNPCDGYWIGTPGYAPAEQQQNQHEPKSDLYAVAASMHELLSGIKPRDFDFRDLGELGLELNTDLVTLIHETLEPWPEDRPIESAREMKERLCALPYSLNLPSPTRDHHFEAAVSELMKGALGSRLRGLIERYGHECQTPFVPATLSFLRFTLGTMTPFELLITKDCDREAVRFEEKQGLLDPLLLGEVQPLDPSHHDKVDSLIDKFVADYEDFKNSSWQLL